MSALIALLISLWSTILPVPHGAPVAQATHDGGRLECVVPGDTAHICILIRR